MPLTDLLANQGLVLAARLIVATVFLLAAMAKLTQRPTFAADVLQYRLLPRPLGHAYAFALPWIELIVAAALFLGVLVPIGASLALILVFSFAVAVVSALARRLNLECSCFGLLYRERVGRQTLIRDGILALLCVEIVSFNNGRFDFTSIMTNPSSITNIVVIVLVIFTLLTSVILFVRSTEGRSRSHSEARQVLS